MWADTSVSGGFENTGGAQPKRSQHVMPVMIGHLVDDDDTDVWGQEMAVVTFLGIVRHIEETTTKISYEVEDETGKITGHRWLEADSTNTDPDIELNTYIRVHGYLRKQNESKHVLVLRITPLTDLNELTNHLLEVTYAMLLLEKAYNEETLGVETVKATAVGDTSAFDDGISGLTEGQSIVFKIIQKENDTLNGIERSELKSRVPKHIFTETDDILDFLINEGHIYTTLTDDHFKTT